MQIKKELGISVKLSNDELNKEELSVEAQDELVDNAINHAQNEAMKGFKQGQLCEVMTVNGIEYEFDGWWEMKEPTFATMED